MLAVNRAKAKRARAGVAWPRPFEKQSRSIKVANAGLQLETRRTAGGKLHTEGFSRNTRARGLAERWLQPFEAGPFRGTLKSGLRSLSGQRELDVRLIRRYSLQTERRIFVRALTAHSTGIGPIRPWRAESAAAPATQFATNRFF